MSDPKTGTPMMRKPTTGLAPSNNEKKIRYVIYHPERDAFFAVDHEANELNSYINWVQYQDNKDYFASPEEFMNYIHHAKPYHNEKIAFNKGYSKLLQKEINTLIFVPVKSDPLEQTPEIYWEDAFSVWEFIKEWEEPKSSS